ncbi:MAG: tRNA adenosine(34) deaminase TadA [Planctomycetota bacterium]
MTPPPPGPERDEYMMRIALDQARCAAELGEVPVGAVVYRLEDGQVLARAHNLRENDADPTAHAEVIALRKAARQRGVWRLETCGLAVTLEPCPMCAGAIVNARIGELVYGAADPKMGCVDTLHHLCAEPRFNHRLTHRSGVLAEECSKILKSFFAVRRGQGKAPDKPRPRPTD